MILFVPISILAKQVCIAPSGCSIEIDTGLCPNCIEVKEEPPIIKEEKVVEKKPVFKVSNPPLYPRVNESLGNKVKTNKKKGVCYVPPCDWLETPYLVSHSKPKRNCSQRWVCVVPPCDWIDKNGCLIGN